MKRANYIISICGAVIGVVFLLIGKTYSSASVDGGYTTAATWPTILSWVMIGLSVLLAVVNTLKENDSPSAIQLKSPEFGAVIVIIICLIAYYISFRYLGCLITIALFMPILLWFFGERRWKLIVIFDACTVLGIYLLFQVVLESKLAEPFFA